MLITSCNAQFFSLLSLSNCHYLRNSFPLIVSSNLLRLWYKDGVSDSLCLPLFLWLIQGLESLFWLFISSINKLCGHCYLEPEVSIFRFSLAEIL